METGPSPYEVGAKTKEEAYWNARYAQGQTSGAGSYGEGLRRKLKALEAIPDVSSVLEIGCGDFNFGKHVMFQYKLPMEHYTGYDISKVILERNRGFYPKCTWLNEFPNQGADLLLCVDVLFHVLDDSTNEQLLDNLSKLWTKYLVVTGYEKEQTGLSQHLTGRKFDPSRFGTPLVREIVEDDGELRIYVYSK